MVRVISRRRLESCDVGQRRVLQLDNEFLAVVRRDQVDGEPHALGLAAVQRMARKFRNSSVVMARTTSGLLELTASPCGMPVRSS